ncbi:unnamed protein product, partial [Polarella glacialis]
MASATMAELRSSYRRMALRTHPDKGGNSEDFRQVLEAFAVLSSSRARAAYDSSIRARQEAASSRSRRTTKHTLKKSQQQPHQQQQKTQQQQQHQQQHQQQQQKKPQEGCGQPASSSPQQQTDTKQQQQQQKEQQQQQQQQQHTHYSQQQQEEEEQADAQQQPKSSSVPPPAGYTANSEAQGQGSGSDAKPQTSTHPAHQVSACMARLRVLAFQMPRPQREASLQALLPQLRLRFLEFMQVHGKPEVDPGQGQHAAEGRRSRSGTVGTEGAETPQETQQERVLDDPMALAPVSPGSDSSKSSSGSDDSDIDEVLALENQECSMLLAVEDAEDAVMGLGGDDSGDQGESDPDCKLPTAAIGASNRQAGSSGYRGVSRRVDTKTGLITYQAGVIVNHVEARSSYTASAEESVDFHIALVQLRESVEQGVEGADGVEGSLTFEQSFRAAFQQRQEELGKLSLSFSISFRAFGVKFHTPNTTKMEEALEVRSRLLAAREEGVSALQACLIEVLTAGRTNVHKKSRSWSL